MVFLDLEKNFAFYAAYHNNPINVTIHMIFVWPIFLTAILILNFVPTPFNVPCFSLSLFEVSFLLVFNFGFLLSLIYGVVYVCFDIKSGSFAALLCLFCWVVSSFLASVLGFSLAWKVVLVVQLVSWTAQFIGHGLFEVSRLIFITYKILSMPIAFAAFAVLKGKAPALLDNILQAFLMAPFFVLFEALQIIFGYEPYPGFRARVKSIMDAETENARNKKEKLLA